MKQLFLIKKLNYKLAKDCELLTTLLQEYACDPMGGGEAIDKQVLQRLPEQLKRFSQVNSCVAMADDRAAGLSNYIVSFSTFYAAPVINIHDFYIRADFRGYNLSQQLLEFIEDEARAIGSCKITLEVLQGNKVARAAYKKFGFSNYQLSEDAGNAEFWEKKLN